MIDRITQSQRAERAKQINSFLELQECFVKDLGAKQYEDIPVKELERMVIANENFDDSLYLVNDDRSERWVINIDGLTHLLNEERKTYRAEDQNDCELKKEYIGESGLTIKRYCKRKSAEEQKAFEELATRRTWEIVSKYVK